MYSHYTITAPALHLKSFHTHPNFYLSEQYKSPEDTFFHLPDHYFTLLIFCFLNRSKTVVPHQSYCTDLPQFIAVIALKHFHAAVLPWQTNSTLIIFSYLHLSLVFLLKRLIFQGFPTFEFSFLFKVSSQIFSYFLMFFPAILVNPLVKQASLPTGFFNYSLSDILLPLHHQNSHGCKCSRLH